jgi:hypothetical protein
MYSLWFRSRLLWIGLFGFIFIACIWMSPFLMGEGRYFGARWIAPGDFYQGFGITQDFHRIGLWVGRPYAGWGNPMRQTGITSLSFPFDPIRHPWYDNEPGPIWFQWGTPSGNSFTVKVDYWFLMPFCFMVWVASMFSWQRRKRRLLAPPTIETNAQQAGASNGG